MKASVNEKNLPKKLRAIKKWGLWRFIRDKNKPDSKPRKVPLKLDGDFASPTAPRDFNKLRDVLTSQLIRNPRVEGLAFALFESDDITVFDFDNISELTKKQRARIMRLCESTYSEWSQSKNGIHCFFSGHDERILRKKFNWGKMQVEVYRTDRFIAVTGDRVDDCPRDLADYDTDVVESCLGTLPDEAQQPPAGVNDEESQALRDREPTIDIDDILSAIERDAAHDTRDAGPVHEWLEDGYDGGDDRSSNDLILCKVLWKYGAVYSQIEEIVLTRELRGDKKWERDDYRSSTILRAYAESDLAGFDDGPSSGPRGGGSGGKGKSRKQSTEQSKKKKKSFSKRMKKTRKALVAAVHEYNESTARLGAGQVAERAIDRLATRIDKLKRTCHKLAGDLNLLDVQRLNQWYGEVVIGSEVRVGAYYNGKKRLMRWETFEKVMRSQREAVALKERAPRGRADTGILKIENVPSADHWLAHPEHLRFPLEPELYPSPDMLYTAKGFRKDDLNKPYNLFEGCQYKPEPGVDYAPIIRHIHNVWASRQLDITEYILNWMARMVQYPHMVGQTAIVLRSIEGVGKNVVTNIFKRYYGIHAVDITDMDSVRGFNAMPMRSVMTVFNEATYGGNKKTAGALKAMVTDEYLTSQEKYQPSITHRNCSHILIFSNNDWIVPVGLDDRRFLILECDSSHMDTAGTSREKYFRKLIDECINKGGDRAFIYHLLNRDISQFNPRNIPLQKYSHAHMEQTMRGLTPLHKWAIESAQRGGILLSTGIVVEWKKDKVIKISLNDVRDSFMHSVHGKRTHEASGEVMYGISRKLSNILNCNVDDLRNVKCRAGYGRGRGIKIPSLNHVYQSCRLLHDESSNEKRVSDRVDLGDRELRKLGGME